MIVPLRHLILSGCQAASQYAGGNESLRGKRDLCMRPQFEEAEDLGAMFEVEITFRGQDDTYKTMKEEGGWWWLIPPNTLEPFGTLMVPCPSAVRRRSVRAAAALTRAGVGSVVHGPLAGKAPGQLEYLGT